MCVCVEDQGWGGGGGGGGDKMHFIYDVGKR